MTTGTLGTFAIGTIAVPSTVTRVPPVVAITAPIGTVTTSTTTVTWTYTSPISRPQLYYRLILTTSSDGILFDTGVVASAAVSHALGYVLTPFTAYKVFLGVSDGLDGDLGDFESYGGLTVFRPGWTGVSFFTEFASIPVQPTEQRVGSVYEIAINGVGYMLEDNPERPVKMSAAQLNPERFATGDTPFSEAIDRYSYMGFSDWRDGAGQLYRDRPTSSESRYYHSEGVNPFEVGEVSCLNGLTQHIPTTYAQAVTNLNSATVASGDVYIKTANNQLTSRDTPGGANTAFAPMAGGVVSDLCSDGTNWYATNGTVIRRNNTPATPADWSTVAVTEIDWIGDRIAGLDTAAVPPNFTTFTPAGVEEFVGGVQSFTGATLRGLCGGDGHAWFGVNYSNTGRVQAWALSGGVGTTFIALTLPEGETVDNLYFYLGNVFIAARADDGRIKIYRCAASEGRLTPELIVDYNTDVSLAYQVQFAGMDRFVAFAWFEMHRDAESGIGVIDLETGGYAPWHAAGNTFLSQGRNITGVVRWAGDFGVVVTATDADGGFYGAAVAPAAITGFIETSVSDLASNVTKVLEDVTLTTRPLNGTVQVFYSVNNNEAFASLGTMSGSGVTTTSFAGGVLGSSFGFKLILTPSGSEGPVVKLLQPRTYPKGLTDQIVTLPVNCGDTITGLNDVVLLPDSGPGKGIARVRVLQTLVGELVTLQDVDWRQTRATATYQVVGAEADLVGAYDRNKTYRVDHGVCTVTLRRATS